MIAFNTTNIIKNRSDSACLRCGLVAILLSLSQSACAVDTGATKTAPAGQAVELPFPAGLGRYQARLFELTEPDEPRFDPAFASQLATIAARQIQHQANFIDRLTSGPATNARYYRIGDRAYVHYAVCQAHHCDTTTLNLLYEPQSRRMVGKLIDRCTRQWLGQPTAEEAALLEQQNRAIYPATDAKCRDGK